jgi:hypothetical protein
MHPVTTAWPLSLMTPMTPYCGPGPERMLSVAVAVAVVAADAMVDKAAVAIAATSMAFLLCMVACLLFEECSSNVSGQPRVP